MNRKFLLISIGAMAWIGPPAPAAGTTAGPASAPPASAPTVAVPGAVAPTPATPDAPAKPAPGSARTPSQRDETAIDFLWRKSDEAFHAGDYERSIACHKAIVALDPTMVESYGLGAWLMWSLGHGDQAVAFIERGVQANPQDWEMWDTAGQQYDLQKLTAQAETAYSHAVALIPKTEDSEMLRRRLAHAARRNGDLATSLQTWRDLVRDFPNHAVDVHNRDEVEALAAAADSAAAAHSNSNSASPPATGAGHFDTPRAGASGARATGTAATAAPLSLACFAL